MAFLRQRNSSQCSFSKGDDEIIVRRIEQTDVSRKPRSDTSQSTRSSCSSVEASDFAIHDSCVTDEYITEDERRTCPLLWCRDVFDNQEAMLQHVWNCPYLSKGLYWCFHCQKPERVGKFNCKRCQGAPSRTDRVTSVAKKIFSKLGAKPHRSDSNTASSSSASSKNISKMFEQSECPVPPYVPMPIQQEEDMMNWMHSDAQELPSSSVVPEMAGDWTAASHELPDTSISEMVGTECFIELGGGAEAWEDNFYTADLEDWIIPSVPSPKGRGSSPKLEIDTSVAHTSQLTTWIDTPLSATIISPLSTFGNFDSGNDASPLEVSPTDSVVSGKSFFTDSGYSSATTQSANSSSRRFDRFPSIPDQNYKNREVGIVSEAWIKGTASSIPQPISSVVATPIVMQNTERCNDVIHSAGRCTKPDSALVTAHWHDASGLVQSFSESLRAHLQHTKSALRMLPQTSTTFELMSMSRTSIISIGLEVLTGILESRNPTAIVQIFAFTHIACAIAIAIEDNEAKILTQEWFQDSLQWVFGLKGEKEQRIYERVARAIWQPLEILVDSVPRSGSSNQNSLYTTSKHFLDIFESLDSPKINISTNFPQLRFAQPIFEHNAKILVIDELIKKPRIEAFIEDVVKVEKRLSQGQIPNTRSLEIELICAGKRASQSDAAYGRYMRYVTALCDTLYAEQSFEISRREHHIRDVSRIKRLMLEDTYDEEAEQNHSWYAEEYTTSLLDVNNDDEVSLLFDLDLAGASKATMAVGEHRDVTVFSRNCDEMLCFTHDSHTNVHIERDRQYEPHPRTPSQYRSKNEQPSTGPKITLHPPPPKQLNGSIRSPVASSRSPAMANPPTPSDSSSIYRCYCGYVPSGEEKWKASNLRRHKRIQHAAESKLYVCRWEGCKSSFTRSDNLRCHIREKGHYDGAEQTEEGAGGDGSGRGCKIDEDTKRRKRKRASGDAARARELDIGRRMVLR